MDTYEAHIAAEQDMRDRWLPTETQLDLAVLMAKKTGNDVVTALVQPGKEYGFWSIGQEVEPVMVFAEFDRHDVDQAEARRSAVTSAARAQLGDRDGTVSWVWVRADGTASVFESF